MGVREPKIAIFAGTFDPPTYGHLNIIERSRRLFDQTIVAVGVNPEKEPLFSPDERVEILQELVGDAADVKIESYSGLTMDFVNQRGADVIVKGIRDSDDLRNELRQANVNMIAGDVETVFLFTTDQTALISSTLIRQIAEMGGLDSGKMTRLIPPSVVQRMKVKLGDHS
ncbi:MAG: pantetheine-phosphate adenylyltransferase [Phycisphaerales bacterium]|nr:pantetheine-phosphate adenylyltransferase [Phycisphaerales bacterium]MCB9857671.1 pantetheine-phosphate adenylyltransferase [Phycisphaerales bacterium]